MSLTIHTHNIHFALLVGLLLYGLVNRLGRCADASAPRRSQEIRAELLSE